MTESLEPSRFVLVDTEKGSDRSERPAYEMFSDLPDMCSTEEAAEGLGCSTKTVRAMVRRRELFAVHVGRVLRIPKTSLIDFAEGRAPRGEADR